MKKKIRDLTKAETDKICRSRPLCACCPLNDVCCDSIDDVLHLVQEDLLNVYLNQEIEIEGEENLK